MDIEDAMAQGGLSDDLLTEFVRRISEVCAKLEAGQIAVTRYVESAATLARTWTEAQESVSTVGHGAALPDELVGHDGSSVRRKLESAKQVSLLLRLATESFEQLTLLVRNQFGGFRAALDESAVEGNRELEVEHRVAMLPTKTILSGQSRAFSVHLNSVLKALDALEEVSDSLYAILEDKEAVGLLH